jgi:hypothetical protein
MKLFLEKRKKNSNIGSHKINNKAMDYIAVKVDFRQLLEDIEYTNKVTKKFDVSKIITRNQYYELKDALVLWMLQHQFTENSIDGLEYTTGKYGDKIELVKLTISYGDTKCLLHQNLKRKMCEIFGLYEIKEDDFVEYIPSSYDDVEFDENHFRECISRMKTNRIRFIRESNDGNNFWGTIDSNGRSSNPWMRPYLVQLPYGGRRQIRIVDKNN